MKIMQNSTEQLQLRIRCEKVIRVRRGVRRKDGRFFTQREFAKLLGYPIARYAEAEKKDEAVDNFLLENLIMICHANPYYLYDDYCAPWEGEYIGKAVDRHEAPAIITTYDTILKWIQQGKPRNVNWTDEFQEEII